MLKPEIKSEEHVKAFVDGFYNLVNEDELLSPIFNNFAKVNWEAHMPTMYGFWNKILLGTGSYTGSPFDKHIPLPIEQKHFDRWIALFEINMDQIFQGELAEEAKLRARSIGGIFAAKHKFLKEQKEQ